MGPSQLWAPLYTQLTLGIYAATNGLGGGAKTDFAPGAGNLRYATDLHCSQEPGSQFWCHAMMRLQFAHVRSFACRGRLRNFLMQCSPTTGPRAACCPPQRFRWPAEAFRKNLQIWNFLKSVGGYIRLTELLALDKVQPVWISSVFFRCPGVRCLEE